MFSQHNSHENSNANHPICIQHVNSSCILINESPRCNSNAGATSAIYESFYSTFVYVCVRLEINYNFYMFRTIIITIIRSALILSGYDPSHPYSPNVNFGRVGPLTTVIQWMYLFWSRRLYDSESNKIFNQCSHIFTTSRFLIMDIQSFSPKHGQKSPNFKTPTAFQPPL
jgi:hypothetical protein